MAHTDSRLGLTSGRLLNNEGCKNVSRIIYLLLQTLNRSVVDEGMPGLCLGSQGFGRLQKRFGRANGKYPGACSDDSGQPCYREQNIFREQDLLGISVSPAEDPGVEVFRLTSQDPVCGESTSSTKPALLRWSTLKHLNRCQAVKLHPVI